MERIYKGKRKHVKRLMMFILSLVLLGGSISLFQRIHSEAATSETADIRFIFTTDLHGSITTTNYETGEPYNTGSLAKAYTLIKEARAEKDASNSFTFDVGDVLYDYTTETIFETDSSALQPIYQAMTKIGYDAITLGNHEFDYGYNYIMAQMRDSGLGDICIVSNLFNAKTGNTVFDENRIITREIKTSSGKTVSVNIGIIGETIPVLTKKRENYIGTLETEDVVENVTKEAAALKKEGADFIVVLAHSGFGVEDPAPLSGNTAYALTKISGVDVVLCGHEHNMFPSTSSDSQEYYTLSGVDKKTGLVNGKNLVMASDKGQSIGVADLKIRISGTSKTIISRSSEVREVKTSTAADATINAMFSKWAPTFNAAIENVVGTVADGQNLNNYLGIVQDTNTIQLLNDAKINYALKYINSTATQYIGYPIIAASTHTMGGQLSAGDYANITGEISEAKLATIAPFNKYLFLYEITGKQLKEWLEWSASAYQNLSTSVTWTDEAMNSAMETSGLQSLVSEEWLDEWTYFFVFDGISYTINPIVEPRYNYYGTKINDTSRISSLTYNGKEVTDDMKFVLATESVTNSVIPVMQSITNQAIYRGINKTITALADYVKQQSETGKIASYVDYNWNFSLPGSQNFIVKASEYAQTFMSQYPWNYSLLNEVSGYNYYKVNFNSNILDTSGPDLVLASSNENKTNQNVRVGVSVSDPSGIRLLKYTYGDYDKDFNWENAVDLLNYFTVMENGTYTVYAEDNNGNSTIRKIKISNINTEILQAPTVNSYTNRMSNITGKGEAGATIYFKTADGEYESTVASDGTFTYALPSQKSGSTFSVYVKDSSGRSSDETKVTVKRTGPNMPAVEEIKNNTAEISGKINDLVSEVKTIFAIANKKVYVSKNGGADAYASCDKYVSSYTIVETDVTINKDGTYSIGTSGINADTKVTVYTYDYADRLSKANISSVTEAGPNPPSIFAVCNAENTVYGKLTSTSGALYNITLLIGNSTYQGVTDASGNFAIEVGKMTAGNSVRVYAAEQVDGVTRKSVTVSRNITDVKKYVTQDESEQGITLDPITDKATEITGSTNTEGATVIINIGDEFYEVTCEDDDWSFTLPLDSVLKSGTQVNAVIKKEYSNNIVAAVSNVVVGLPYQPVLLNKGIYNTTKKLQVTATEKVTVNVKVGSQVYTSDNYTYDSASGNYLYNVTISNVNSGTNVTIYATNSAGNSPKQSLTVTEKAPDTPTVSTINTNTTVVKGKVDLILAGNEDGLKTPTVNNTGTKVYVKARGVIYTATVKDDGTFEVKIPKQIEKTSIFVWGVNSQGKGPVKTVKVVKASK